MAGIIRKTAKIFGGSLAPTGNIEAFASKAGGTPVWSNDPNVIQTAAWLQGLAGSLATGQAPYLEDQNGILFVLSYLLSYLHSRGVPEWDSSGGNVTSPTTYNTGDWCRRGPVNTGPHVTPYICQADGITSDPLTDTNNWKTLQQTLGGLFDTRQLCKAWVRFNGFNGAISAGYNVSSVTRLSAGQYQINFTVPMADADFVWSGVVGDGTTGGNNNHLIEIAHATTSVTVMSWEPSGGPIGPEDSQTVMVQVFGN
jgi:hypothetical protein